jgi:predicted O-methyltransferase YrrM
MIRFAAIFRTHVWDSDISEMAARAERCCGTGTFVIATDESKGPLSVGRFSKLSHTEDFSSYSLPSIPPDKVLWWNADYVLYLARRSLPDYDYYAMLEYDVHMNCDLPSIIEQCANAGIDLVARYLRPIEANHWSRPSIIEMSEDPWWALIPFVILSARAVDALLQRRQDIAVQLKEGKLRTWPYCETFIPTVIKHSPGMSLADASQFVNADMLRWRPFLSSRDPLLDRPNSVAHPVMSGQRFIRAFLSYEPPGSHLMTDGQLRTELQHENLSDLRSVLGDTFSPPTAPKSASQFLGDEAMLSRTSGRLIDLARDKPATQSSHSQWSRGATAEEDACRAVSGELPSDYAFHTASEDNPWWQVDLTKDCAVGFIEITNRPVHFYRFTKFRVDSSSDNQVWVTQFTKTDGSLVSSDAERPSLFAMPSFFTARYIRIVQLGHDVMNLRRIRVLGTGTNDLQPHSARTKTEQELATLMTGQGDRDIFIKSVTSIVHEKVFGRGYDSYNIDTLAFFAAGISSSQYAVSNMANSKRFENAALLRDFAAQNAPPSGMILEFGVFSGDSINRLATQLPERHIFGFDSFEGLPETWRPGFQKGAFHRTSLPTVRDNVELIVGWFDKTLPTFAESHKTESLALLHVDCDLYSSTKTIFALLAGHVVPGTVIVFDEYFNYPGWPLHEYKAFQEFVSLRKIKYEYIGLVPSHQQVAVRVLNIG